MQSYKYVFTFHVYYSICSIIVRQMRNFFYHLENKQVRTLKETEEEINGWQSEKFPFIQKDDSKTENKENKITEENSKSRAKRRPY